MRTAPATVGSRGRAGTIRRTAPRSSSGRSRRPVGDPGSPPAPCRLQGIRGPVVKNTRRPLTGLRQGRYDPISRYRPPVRHSRTDPISASDRPFPADPFPCVGRGIRPHPSGRNRSRVCQMTRLIRSGFLGLVMAVGLAPTPLRAGDDPVQSTAAPAANGCVSCDGGCKLRDGFAHRLIRAYCDEFKPQPNGDGNGNDEQEPPRRALPAPFASPFPSSEWQGFPLIGVPPSTTVYPLMKAIYGGPFGDAIKDSRIKSYGWVNASGNWSTAKQ